MNTTPTVTRQIWFATRLLATKVVPEVSPEMEAQLTAMGTGTATEAEMDALILTLLGMPDVGPVTL